MSRATFQADPLVCPELGVPGRELLEPHRFRRVDDLDPLAFDAQRCHALPEIGDLTEKREVDDLPLSENLAGKQDAIVRPLGQNDVLTIRSRPFEELVLEHDRRDRRGSGDCDAPLELGLIDVRREEREGGCDLALVRGSDDRADGADPCRRGEGVVFDAEDRHAGRSEAFDQVEHLRTRDQSPAQNDPGNLRESPGQGRGKTGEDDVGSISGSDDEAARPEMIEEVRNPHRGHLAVKYVAIRPMPVAENQLRLQLFRDRRHGRLPEGLVLGDDPDGIIIGLTLREPPRDLAHVVPRHPVDDCRGDGAALLSEGLAGRPDDPHDLVRPLLAPICHDQDGGPQMAGDACVEVELERRGDTAEVGPLTNDEVALLLQLLVPAEDLLDQPFVPAGREHIASLFVLLRVERFVGKRQIVEAPDQLDVVVGGTGLPDDRPKEAEPSDPAREHVHHAQHDQRLPAPRLDRDDVEIPRHAFRLVRPGAVEDQPGDATPATVFESIAASRQAISVDRSLQRFV